MSFNKIIDVYDRQPIQPRYRTEPKSILASAYELVDKANSQLPVERHISHETVQEIISREGDNLAVAQRAIANFVSTVENPNTNTPTKHTDLLTAGHPLFTGESTREDIAAYFSSDPSLSEDVRPLVASAIIGGPDSALRKFNLVRLSAKTTELSYIGIISDADSLISSK